MNTILIEKSDGVATVTLNRPEARNAFNEDMMQEIKSFFDHTVHDDETDVVVLKGEGKGFCAGADLNYMFSAQTKTREQNIEEGLLMAHMLKDIALCPKPTIAVVHGACLGGGIGLAAACDVVLAHEKTSFAFAEIKLGLAPSVISPFVIAKIGLSHARRFFITGEKFGAKLAVSLGLVHVLFTDESLPITLAALIQELKQNSQPAISAIKDLIDKNQNLKGAELTQFTAEHITNLRQSEDARARMKKFLQQK